MTTLNERLEAIEREILEQDEAWQRTKAALARLEQVELAVPRETLSRIVGPAGVLTPPLGSVRG